MDLTCMSSDFPPEAETTRSGTENLIYSPKINKRTHVFFSFFNEGKTNVGSSSGERRRLHGNEQEKKTPSEVGK